ncbi:MAG TPA: ABC transporter permease [Gemmatimonadaceae bacterium]|nr:ABC transporter permease [Gemmatimonadaceae bacterium]
MRPLRFLLRKEFRQIFRDRMIVRLVFVLPMVQLLILSNAATFEVKSARLYVVDEDHTSMSRAVADRLVASGRFMLTERSQSTALANDAMLNRRIDIALVVPAGFEKSVVRERRAAVQLILNAEDGAAAGVTQSYAARIINAYAAEIGARVTPRVRAQPPIEVVRRGWYNAGLRYRDFMLPGILVVLVTIVGTLMTAMNIVREKEAGTLDQINVTPVTRQTFIAAKLIPLWTLAMLDLILGMVLARFVFGLPMTGNPMVILVAAAIYLVAALGIGLWVSAIVETQQQAMFVTYSILMIYLLMSGLFTPIRAMPDWAQWIAEVSPVTHFISLMRAVLLKGAGFRDVAHQLRMLSVIGTVVLAVAVRQYHKRAA